MRIDLTLRRRGSGLLPVFSILMALALTAGCTTTSQLRQQGVQAYSDRNMQSAESHFAQVLDRRPTDVTALYYMGLLALERGQAAEARKMLEVAHTLTLSFGERGMSEQEAAVRPSERQITDALAHALYDSGQRFQLIQFLQSKVAEHGEPIDYLRLAHYQRLVGDPDSAAVTYRQLNQVHPLSAHAYVEQAEFFAELGMKDQAILALRRAYYLQPYDTKVRAMMRQMRQVPGPTFGLKPVVPPPDASTVHVDPAWSPETQQPARPRTTPGAEQMQQIQ